MESGPTQKVRLVRCPKCRMILPEPPNVLVYKCGGCGTVLQAKKRSNTVNSPTSGSQETEAAKRNESNRVSELGECSCSSSQNTFFPSSGECSSDQHGGGDKEAATDHVSSVVETRSSTDKAILLSSTQCSFDQNEGGDKTLFRYHVFEVGESSGSSQEKNLPSSGEGYFDQNGGGDQEATIYHVSHGGETRSSIQKTIPPSSDECFLDQNMGKYHGSEGGEFTSSSQKAILPSSDECSLDQSEGGYRKRSRDHVSEMGDSSSSDKKEILFSSDEFSMEQNGGGDKTLSRSSSASSFEDLHSPDEDQNGERNHESQGCNIKQPGVSNEICSSNGDANLENGGLSQLARAVSGVELTEVSSAQAWEKLAVDIDSENNLKVRSLTTDGTARRENDSTSHNLAAESFSTDIILSSPDEQPTQRQLNINLSYERREFFSPRSEVSSKIECNAKSPRFRSSCEYDGSVSSYDGTSDQVPVQHMNLHKDTFKIAKSVISEEHSRRDKFQGNSIMNGNSKMQGQARNLSSPLPDTRPYTMDHRKWNGDELLGSIVRGVPVSNGTRLHDEFQSPSPFCQKVYRADYGSRSASTPSQDDFHHSSSEQEKLKLLRLVYELHDRINKTCHVGEQENGRVSAGLHGKEKYIPALNSGEIPEDDMFHDVNNHIYPDRWRQVSNWTHQHKVSRKPFSGDATDNPQHLNCSCMHSYPIPQDSQCSAPLPPPFLPPNRGYRRFHFHPGHDSYNDSYPLRPQHFADSEFPIGRDETESDYYRHADHQMKEKNHLVKRHLRPTAGGAPFLTCYNCLNPLQLPADFLVFKRRFHLLKCGACSKILRFALERRTHITPYTPETAAPPALPNNFSNDGNRGNSVSSSHGNGFSPADPVSSCSDDYGLSHCKSYSTDGDPIILATFHNGKRNTDGRHLSFDSSESIKERPQFIRKLLGNKNKNPSQTQQASPGSSSNKSTSRKEPSEIELPARSGSPLHRLMGYSTISQVFRGSGPSSSGTSPHCMKEPAVTKKKYEKGRFLKALQQTDA